MSQELFVLGSNFCAGSECTLEVTALVTMNPALMKALEEHYYYCNTKKDVCLLSLEGDER